jgi:hypothetical protein
MTDWATYYDEIPEALENNDSVRSHALELIAQEPILGGAVEGGTRTDDFRNILDDVFRGEESLSAAETRVERELPKSESPNSHDTQNTFNQQWAERLVRMQASRFYNQSVFEILQENGESHCYIHRSPDQDADSGCTRLLSETEQPISDLLHYLYSQQRDGNWDDGVTIPDHPNCTHTVVPVYTVEP